MDGYWFELAVIGGLMMINGFFAGSEIALISLREGQLRALERRDTPRDRTVVRLARDPTRFLGTVQLGMTLAGYLASATAAVTLAQPVASAMSFLGNAADAVAVAVVTAVLTAANLVVGELVPKRLAMQYARTWSAAVAVPLSVFATLSRPVTWLLGKASDVLVRSVGGNPTAGREQLSPEELRELVVAHPGLTVEQRTIIAGALEIRELALRDVLVPRRAVVTLPHDMDVGRARGVLVEAGHSRAPVVRWGNLDNVVGVVHLRDLLTDGATVAAVARPALELPHSLRIADAMSRLRAEHEKFALVIDEHGGVAGIVTIEDLLEEVVGEIYDETDRNILAARTLPDGSIVVPGSFPIHDLPDINVEMTDPGGDYTTIAGLVLARLGRVPDRSGDRVELARWTVEVTGVAQHAITEVRIIPTVDRGNTGSQG